MSKIKILYVEDEAFLAKIVKESLESRGFLVQHIENGLLALPAFQQFNPDICVLDVMLPSKDGFSIGKKIRTINPHIPILYLTAKNQTQDLLKGFQSGGNDYIRKPFSMEELIVRIENLLALTQQENIAKKSKLSDPIKLGNYTYYPKKYELHLGQHIQKLSHRQAQLFSIFVENKNMTSTRKDILERIWGHDNFFNSRNLDVYINKLRSYIKQDDSIRIVTLKNVGFQFVVDES